MDFVCAKDLWESNAELGLVSVKACTVSSTVPSEEVGSIGKVGSDSVGMAVTKTTALIKSYSASHTSRAVLPHGRTEAEEPSNQLSF